MGKLNRNFRFRRRLVLSTLIISLWLPFLASAQQLTRVKGTVRDADTNEVLPFVNIYFEGTNIGTTTDINGKYFIETQWGSGKIVASFVGYDADTTEVKKGSSQTLNINLSSSVIALEAVTVKAKKKRYRNKDNPAVRLIREVVAHKKDNRKESLDYYEYNKYEKVEFDLNNITKAYTQKKIFRKFQFIFDYVDTSEVSGKPYLPIFLRETSGQVYYRKKPKAKKEYQKGLKITGFKSYLDNDGISFLMDKMYQDINIYDNQMTILADKFVSPIADIGPGVYKYMITDTVTVDDQSQIKLSFLPRNPLAMAFTGSMMISNDSSFRVVSVDLGITKSTDLNFVNDLQIKQEFEPVQDSIYMLSRDEISIDFNSSDKVGLAGTRTVSYNDFKFNIKRADSTYKGDQIIVKEPFNDEQTSEFWKEARHEPLSQKEEGVYHMIDTVQTVPAFKRTMDIIMLVLVGYKDFGPVDIGPVNAFYSFNDVEGLKLKIGGQTNLKFNKKSMIETFLAYGFKDKEWKYSLGYTYSFNRDWLRNPKHYIKFSIQHDTNFPGQGLDFINEDNFLLSFKRGGSDKLMFYDSYKFEYMKEFRGGFSYQVIGENRKQRPLGSLSFQTGPIETPQITPFIRTTELNLNLRYAPNEQFYQSKKFRIPLKNKYPIFNLRMQQGFDNVLGGQYGFSRVTGSMFKRTYLWIFGYLETEITAGKLFGTVPYPLLNLPKANQTYAYQLRSYNMMNFLEFLTDEYVSINAQHFFNGLFFNKIPLLKRLKLREVVSFKALWGSVSDKNNPNLNPEVFRFPFNSQTLEPETYFLNDGPYMEASAGITNIFKVFRVDVVKRLTYLDHPTVGPGLFGVTGMGIRARLKLEF